MQSGFPSGYSTVSATLKVLDDIKEAFDKKHTCVSLCIDLSKAFDTMDRSLLINTLLSARVGRKASQWFHSYLSNRSQVVKNGNVICDSVLIRLEGLLIT